MTTKYPNVTVNLIGNDGNAFYVVGATMRAMRLSAVTDTRITDFYKEATSGDYDHLLQTVMEWVNVE